MQTWCVFKTLRIVRWKGKFQNEGMSSLVEQKSGKGGIYEQIQNHLSTDDNESDYRDSWHLSESLFWQNEITCSATGQTLWMP